MASSSKSSSKAGTGTRTRPAERGSILADLREQTRAEHDAIERSLGALMHVGLDLEAYRRILARLYGYFCPVEASLRGVAGLIEVGVDPAPRAKAPLLVVDLGVLGVSEPEGLPRCRDHVRPDGVASALGCMYVLEGASLGGQVISRRLRATLGVTPASGGRFFHGYGERTGEMWSAFRASLVTYAEREPEAEGQVVQAAVATFRTLRAWCDG